MKITQIRKEFIKGYTKGGRKKWILIKEEVEEITKETYLNTVKNKNPWGKEYQKKSYNTLGYTVTHIACISPSGENKITYDFIIE